MASDEPQVRLATPDDADAIARLLHDFNTEFDAPSPGVDALGARLRALLGSPATFAVLAIAGDVPIAVALVTLRSNVWHDGPVALLDELYVRPERRGRGAGSALMNTLFRTARSGDVHAIEVNVDEADVDALRFYARHGFGSTEPATGERAFYLRRGLASPCGDGATV